MWAERVSITMIWCQNEDSVLSWEFQGPCPTHLTGCCGAFVEKLKEALGFQGWETLGNSSNMTLQLQNRNKMYICRAGAGACTEL